MTHTTTAEGWLTRNHVLGLFLLAITGALIVLCAGMMVPFLPGLSWGLALAIMTRPIHRCYCRVLGDNGKAAFATALLVALGIILPSYFVIDQVMHELAEAARYVTDPKEIKNFEQKVKQYPQVATVMNWVGGHINLKVYAQKLLEKVAPNPTGIVWGGLWLFGQMALTLLTLFYLLRDRHQWTAAVRQLLPLSIEESQAIFQRVKSTVHATIFGSVMMAGLQGVLGGLGFVAAGLPAPLLWAVVMAFFALIPSLGTWVIWWPAVFYLLATGSTAKAIVLALYCFWLVGSIDNLLYPIVVGREISLHPLLVLLFIVGGIWMFGAAGLVLGPLVLSMMDGLIEIWRYRTAFGQAAETGVES